MEKAQSKDSKNQALTKETEKMKQNMPKKNISDKTNTDNISGGL